VTGREAHALIHLITTENADLAHMGIGFFNPAVEIAAGKIVQLFRNMRAILIWRQYHNRTFLVADPGETAYFHNLQWKTVFLALNMPHAAARDAESSSGMSSPNDTITGSRRVDDDAPLQELCRVVLLIFWNTYHEVSQPGSLIFKSLASLLKAAFRNLLRTNDLPSTAVIWRHFPVELHGLLLWLVLMGAAITHCGTAQGTNQDDDALFFSQLISDFQLRSPRASRGMQWEGAESLIKPFLYVERVFKGRMSSCFACSISNRP
jgi:hypothetical protein